VTLVERSVRGLTLTEAGRDLLDHVRAMGEAATLISMVADGKSQEVTGEVTVTGTDLLVRRDPATRLEASARGRAGHPGPHSRVKRYGEPDPA
jgi:DNA-binding transcriptional LysR family regulator